MSDFDPLAALRVLVEHGVRFVVVGGVAGSLRGSTTITNDLDICYARDGENLVRVAEALRSVNARLRGLDEEERGSFILDAETLQRGDHFTFATDVGDLDLLGTARGVRGYEELDRAADEMDLDGVTVRVASIDDLINMKRAAGRPRDLVEVERLGALREELEARGSSDPGRRPRRVE